MGIVKRFKNAWNAFNGRDPTHYKPPTDYYYGGSYLRPDRLRFTRGNERSFIAAVYNRIAIDVAATTIEHAQLDENGRYKSSIGSSLNECLTLSSNIDQTNRAFIQDVVMSLLDEGSVAIVPVDTNIDPDSSESYDILSMRVGKITGWYPTYVRVELYNDRTGRKEELLLAKDSTAIVENPFYQIMNEPNSTAQRLIRVINNLDALNENSASGKLDLIIQLPYVIKSDARKQQAEMRRKDIEMQLAGSKYGIAYTDGTEKITQLNRAVENNMLSQVQYFTNMLLNQLGMPESVFNGTADEQTMLNYFNRTIEPILSAIVDEMKRKFLSPNARTRGHSIIFFRDPFRLVPVNQIAEIADKMSRNEILSSNEIRQIMGYKPVADERGDELRNKNLNQSTDGPPPVLVGTDSEEKGDTQNGGTRKEI